MLNDFRKFILRGNVLDLAVAVIIGAAFGRVVDAFANGILLNLVGALFGQPSFDSITLTIGDGQILIGAFITALVNFLVIAFALFVVMKAFETLQRRRAEQPEDTPAPTDEALILSEIRDLLRSQR